MVLIVGVGHGLPVAHHPRFGDGADEHSVGAQIHILLHLQGKRRVDVLGQDGQPVVRTDGRHAGKFVRRAAALEAEGLKDLEGRVHGQAVHVENAGLLDDMMRIVGLVDVDGDAVGIVGDLRNGVHDQAVVPLAVVGRDHV